MVSKRTVNVRVPTVRRRCIRALRRAAIPRGAAEDVIQRHRCERRADHHATTPAQEKATRRPRRIAGRESLRWPICDMSAQPCAESSGRTERPKTAARPQLHNSASVRARSDRVLTIGLHRSSRDQGWERRNPEPPAPAKSRSEQPEQIEDREPEHSARGGMAFRFRPNAESQRNQAAPLASGGEIERAGKPQQPRRKPAAPASVCRSESAGAFPASRRPPAASERRRGHSLRRETATAPRNAAASKGR